MQHTDARGNSMSGTFWTFLNHLKNVLSYIDVRYCFSFRLHTDTSKTTGFMHCLVSTWKYTLRQNTPVRKTPLVFFYSSTCIAIAKSIQNLHITIFSVGKHKRHFHKTSKLIVTVINVECEVAAATHLDWLLTHGWISTLYRYCMMLHGYRTWNHIFLLPLSVTVQLWI
jgi:hypothetical protein